MPHFFSQIHSTATMALQSINPFGSASARRAEDGLRAHLTTRAKCLAETEEDLQKIPAPHAPTAQDHSSYVA